MKYILLYPLIEILLFILFGDLLGFLNVIAWIFFSGILGLWLILPKHKNQINLQDISKEPIDWILKRISGFLLLIPGFLTDLLGILILFRPTRNLIWKILPRPFINFGYNFRKPEKNGKDKKKEDKFIDAEYKNLDE